MFCAMSSSLGQPFTGIRWTLDRAGTWWWGIRHAIGRGNVVGDIWIGFILLLHPFCSESGIAEFGKAFRYLLPYRLCRDERFNLLIRGYIE